MFVERASSASSALKVPRDLLLLNVKLLGHLSEGLVRKVEKLRTAAMLSRGAGAFLSIGRSYIF